MTHTSSRQRMLAALSCQSPDRVPCSFMLFGGLKNQCTTYVEFIERQVAMGLDAYVELPPRPPVVANDYYNLHGLPVSHDPRVTIREWIETQPGEDLPIMVKEYHTPAGALRAEVRRTADWRWGNHIPFLDDYLESRSKKFPVTGPADLDALRYLLVPLTPQEIDDFHRESRSILELARRHDLLTTGGWGVGADMFGWLYGLEAMVYAIYDRPEFIREMLALIAEWNRQRMEITLDIGVDLYIKRAWYENCFFWTPDAYREFLLPILKDDVELAHRKGVKLGYIVTANCMPLLDMFAEAGVDVLIGVDPAAWNLAEAKRRLGGKVCLWGGVNGHLTVEQGAPEQVQAEVRAALDVLAPGGGFILSPVDNVRESTPRAQENAQILIDTWQRLTGQK